MKDLRKIILVFLTVTIQVFAIDESYVELSHDQDFYAGGKVIFTAKKGDKLEISETTKCKYSSGMCYGVIGSDGSIGYIKQSVVENDHKVIDSSEDVGTTTTPTNSVVVTDTNITKSDTNSTNIDAIDTNLTKVVDLNTTDTNTAVVDTNVSDTNTTSIAKVEVVPTPTKSKEKYISQFEKSFINHIAYNKYKKAIKFMYDKKHKEAYKLAAEAKELYKDNKENVIDLPYIPGYIRENAHTPRRIYYKIIKQQEYEINRLIRKIKLLNPPIPMIVFNKTSTYIDITITNVGDTPFDKLAIEINYEPVVVFDKIEPNETKTYRYNSSVQIETISFKEEYGFAPNSIEFEQE